MWHKAAWMNLPFKLEFTLESMQIKLVKPLRYLRRPQFLLVIYKDFLFNVTQGRINESPY